MYMQLVLNTYGAYLHKNGNLFRIKVGEEVKEISVRKVNSILIGTSATFSSDAIKMAVENNIDVVFLDEYGEPYGRVWHGRLGSTARIRRKQLQVADTEDGLKLAIKWIQRKFENQIDFITRMRDRRTRLSSDLTERINKLKVLRECLSEMDGMIDEKRQEILGIEGTGGKVYFSTVCLLLPEKYRFETRSRNPAKDEFNCLLNYSYGVLYGVVERACILAGLDPYVGFIHTDHYNKPSLVYDLIENYRIWADETVVGLFSARKVKQSLFDILKNGLTLNKEGKNILLENYMRFLDEPIRYRGRNIKRRDVVQFDCHRLAQKLIGK